jgi:hypothetical protein
MVSNIAYGKLLYGCIAQHQCFAAQRNAETEYLAVGGAILCGFKYRLRQNYSTAVSRSISALQLREKWKLNIWP